MLGLGASINKGGFVSSGPEPLFLDEYSGAAAAYSLRKLSNIYSGPALQVRRESDNVEVDVSFDADGVVSLDSAVTNVTEETSGSSQGSTTATSLGEFVANASYTDTDNLGSTDTARVQCWYDQSGNSNNATQNAAASQPKIVSSGAVIVENGKPAVENVISGVQGLNIPSFTINLSDFTCTLVSKFYADSDHEGRPIMVNDDAGSGLDYRYKQFSIARGKFYIGTSTIQAYSNAVTFTPTNNQQLHTITPTNGYVD